MFSPDGTRLAYVSTKPNGYFNVYVRPIKDGQWAGDEIAVTTRQRFRARPPVLRRVGRQHHAGVDAGRQGAAARLEPRRRRSARATCCACRPSPTASTKAQTVLAEQTLYRTRPDVSIDGKRFIYSSTRGSRRPVQQPLRAADEGRRALQADLLRSTTPFIRDGRRTASGSPTSRTAGGLPQLALLETYGGARRTVDDHVERRWKRPIGVLQRADDRRRDGHADRVAHAPHRVRRQALHAGGRLRARQRRRRSHVPHAGPSASSCRPARSPWTSSRGSSSCRPRSRRTSSPAR